MAVAADPVSLGHSSKAASARKAFVWGIFPALVFVSLWTLGFGLPSLRLEGFDDSFFSEIAHLWTLGRPPYIDAFDIKPPAYFALLALVQTIFGPTIETLRGLSISCNIVACCAVALIGLRLGAPAVGFAAALTCGVLAPFLVANDAYPPLVAVTTLAFLAALSPIDIGARAILAGLIVGAMIMTKQTAVLEGAAVLVLILRDPDCEGRRARSLLGFVAASAIVPGAFILYFSAKGGLGVFFDDLVLFALQRPGGVEISTPAADFVRLLVRISQIGPAVPLGMVAALQARRLFAPAPASRADAIVLWAALALLGLAIQHSRGIAYIGPVIPPTLLLAFAFVQRGLKSRDAAAGYVWITVISVLCIAAAFPYRASKVRQTIDTAAAAEAAASIDAVEPRADDRLLVIDFGGWVNILTNLPPPTPFFHRMHLLCNFPNAGPPRLAEAFAEHPRFVILGAYRGENTKCDGPSAWRNVAETIAAQYREIGHAVGRVDDLRVFEALPSPGK